MVFSLLLSVYFIQSKPPYIEPIYDEKACSWEYLCGDDDRLDGLYYTRFICLYVYKIRGFTIKDITKHIIEATNIYANSQDHLCIVHIYIYYLAKQNAMCIVKRICILGDPIRLMLYLREI